MISDLEDQVRVLAVEHKQMRYETLLAQLVRMASYAFVDLARGPDD